MDLRLSGKRALVCGASQGIGRAVAQELASLGCTVSCLARSEERLQATMESLAEGEHSYLVSDHGDTAALARVVGEEIERNGPFHILVNNSGGPPGGAISEAPDDAFLDALRSHLLANVNLARLVLPGMKDAGYGRVINPNGLGR